MAALTLIEALSSLDVLAPDGALLDLGCGAFPHVPLSLQMEGFRGRYHGVDWFDSALDACQRRWTSLRIDASFSVSWHRRSAWDLDPALFRGAAALVHGTTPRWREGGRVVKPRSEGELRRVLSSLAERGTRDAVFFMEPRSADAIAEVAHLQGYEILEPESVWSAGVPPAPWGRCVIVRMNGAP